MTAAAIQQVDDSTHLKIPVPHLLPEPACQFLISHHKLCLHQIAGKAEVRLAVIAGTALLSVEHRSAQLSFGNLSLSQVRRQGIHLLVAHGRLPQCSLLQCDLFGEGENRCSYSDRLPCKAIGSSG